MQTKGCESAFPEFPGNPRYSFASHGLTKREYFAAMAMQGLVANSKIAKTQNISATAVILADALIAELNKEEK